MNEQVKSMDWTEDFELIRSEIYKHDPAAMAVVARIEARIRNLDWMIKGVDESCGLLCKKLDAAGYKPNLPIDELGGLPERVRWAVKRIRELESKSQWSKSRPTEAGWYMVRGSGFRICVLVSEIAGEIYPDLPHRWDTFDGCEFCPVDWMETKEGDNQV